MAAIVPSGHLYGEVSNAETEQRLSELAVRLRDETFRTEQTGSDLPAALVALLSARSVSLGVTEQVGRVAANLVVESDTNRDALIDAGYPAVCCVHIKGLATEFARRAATRWVCGEGALRGLVASLMNLVIQGHERAIEVLGGVEELGALLHLSDALCLSLSRGQSGMAELEAEDMAEIVQWAQTVLGWTWTIIGLVIDGGGKPQSLDAFLVPLEPYLPPHSRDGGALPDIGAFVSAAESLSGLANRDEASIDVGPFLLPRRPDNDAGSAGLRGSAPQTPLDALILLAKGASSDEDEFAAAKGELINALVGLSSYLGPAIPAQPVQNATDAKEARESTPQRRFWSTMFRWLEPKDQTRSDLRMCAMLALGNSARDDEAARALLRAEGERVVRAIKAELPFGVVPASVSRDLVDDAQAGPSSASAQVQHAAIGLLRNLSIPAENKTVLGAEDWSGIFVRAGIWDEARDMVGSVQGGAVGVLKNLCRDNADNAERFLKDDQAIDALKALSARTDDAAIRFEIARIFANCARAVLRQTSVTPTAPRLTSLPVERLAQEDVLALLSGMLAQAAPYPVLANESIIALALLSTFGPQGTTGRVGTLLQNDCVPVFISILAPTEEQPSSAELGANACTLLHMLDAVRADVKAGLATAEGAVSDEGKTLMG